MTLPARRHATLVILIALTVLAAAPLAGAQRGDPLSVVDPKPGTLSPDAGESASVNYRVVNRGDAQLFVFVEAEAPSGWAVDATPTNFTLPGGGFRGVLVTLTPGADAENGRARVTFTAVNRTSGLVQSQTLTADLEPQSANRVLGLVDNPLPAPLNNRYGTFALNLLVWALLAGLVLAVQEPIIRRAGGAGRTGKAMAKLIRGPVASLIVLIGLNASIGVLPRSRPVVLLDRILETIILVVAVYAVFRLYRSVLVYVGRELAQRTDTEADDVLVPILEKVGAVVIVIVGVLLVLDNLGVDLTVFLAGAGIASVVLGFAAQDTLSNFFSGLYILADRPFRVGDDIQLDTGEITRVEKVGLRTTRLYHYRNHELIMVPNNDLATKRVVNLVFPDTRYRMSVDVGVAYGSDVERVQRLLLQAAEEHPEVLTQKDFEPAALFLAFGDSALQFTLRFFIIDVRERWRIAAEVRERVDALFREHGVTIPFPQRTVWWHGVSDKRAAAALPEAPAVDVAPEAPGNGDSDGAGAGDPPGGAQ